MFNKEIDKIDTETHAKIKITEFKESETYNFILHPNYEHFAFEIHFGYSWPAKKAKHLKLKLEEKCQSTDYKSYCTLPQ